MNRTKHDLSYDWTKLDYQALLDTAIIAYAHTRNELEKLVHETHALPGEHRLSVDHNAHLILAEAYSMVTAAETMHTLEEGLTRHKLEIVGKPEIKDD